MQSGNPNLQTRSALTDNLRARDKARRTQKAALAVAATKARTAQRNDLLPALEIRMRNVGDLKASGRAVRKLEPDHVREVSASISALGFCDPVMVGADGSVLDGLVRVEAAKLLGLTQIPCIEIHHLSLAEQRTLRLAVNRLAEKGAWRLDQLKEEFEELYLLDAPIEISGFSPDEIDQIVLDDETSGIESGPLEPAPGARPIARLGDAFRLGPHLIVCGDSTDGTVFDRLMTSGAGKKENARLILCDPPYNVKIVNNVTRGQQHREFAMASGEMTDEEFRTFNLQWIGAALPHLCDGGVLGAFMDWRGVWTIHSAAAAHKIDLLNMVVWSKTNAGMGSLYRSQYELLPLFKKGHAPHLNNILLGRRGRWRSNVWTYAGASSLGSDARRGLKDHPTTKPVEMLKDALLDLTNREDIVLDAFLGSGSTLIAAHKTGRICRGVELDPLYVDVIVRRYEAETGDTARLHLTGETFAELIHRRTLEAERQASVCVDPADLASPKAASPSASTIVAS